jgi:hypothetical protein
MPPVDQPTPGTQTPPAPVMNPPADQPVVNPTGMPEPQAPVEQPPATPAEGTDTGTGMPPANPPVAGV